MPKNTVTRADVVQIQNAFSRLATQQKTVDKQVQAQVDLLKQLKRKG